MYVTVGLRPNAKKWRLYKRAIKLRSRQGTEELASPMAEDQDIDSDCDIERIVHLDTEILTDCELDIEEIKSRASLGN